MATVGPPSTMVTRIFQLRRDAAHPSMSTTVVDQQPPPGRHHSEHRAPHHRHNAARYVPARSPLPCALVVRVHELTIGLAQQTVLQGSCSPLFQPNLFNATKRAISRYQLISAYRPVLRESECALRVSHAAELTACDVFAGRCLWQHRRRRQWRQVVTTS